MQLTNIPGPEAILAVRKALQEERVNRYLSAAGGNPELAFRLYIWNCDLSEAFHLPLHVAEVVCRNAIHRCLLARLGERWFERDTFRGQLDLRIRQELDRAITEERSQHGRHMTGHHIVSSLSFGFWQHLTTKRFE